MPRNKSVSHEKIINAAREEFSEHGYDDASMRRIGSKCGLTAAALYRHFDNKEAMFEALVEPAMSGIRNWLETHTKQHFEEFPDEKQLKSIFGTDMMREVVYPRMSEYTMIVGRARGSRYDEFINYVVDDRQKTIVDFMTGLRSKGCSVKEISPAELHMLVTAYCAALFEPVAHGWSPEEAVNYLDTIEEFFLTGWKKLMGLA